MQTSDAHFRGAITFGRLDEGTHSHLADASHGCLRASVQPIAVLPTIHSKLECQMPCYEGPLCIYGVLSICVKHLPEQLFPLRKLIELSAGQAERTNVPYNIM